MDLELSYPACHLVPMLKKDIHSGSACGSCVAIMTGDLFSVDVLSSTGAVGIGEREVGKTRRRALRRYLLPIPVRLCCR